MPNDHEETRAITDGALVLGHRDRASLLIAAGRAAEALETRVERAGLTLTLSTDEAAEIASQFGRIVALMTAWHLASSDILKRSSGRPEAA